MAIFFENMCISVVATEAAVVWQQATLRSLAFRLF
jgi:hypothetical protein